MSERSLSESRLPEWISLNDAADTWLCARLGQEEYSQIEKNGGNMNADQAAMLHDVFSQACTGPRFSIRGIKITNPAIKATGPLETISSHHFRHPRTFRPHLNLIEATSDIQSSEQWQASALHGEANPNWGDVVVNTQEYMAWLNEVTNEFLSIEILYGKITAAGAEARLADRGFHALHSDSQASEASSPITAVNEAIKPPIDEHTAVKWTLAHIDRCSDEGTKTTEKQEHNLIKIQYPHLHIGRDFYRQVRRKAVEAAQRPSWLNSGPKTKPAKLKFTVKNQS